MALLQFIVHYTKMGKAMRAVAVDEDAAQLMGIDVDQVISFTFALGSSLAGIAGVLVALYYNTFSATMGIVPGLKAFVAAVLGGIGSIPGAMIGGYVIGLLETLVSYLGFSPYKDGVVYFLLFVILLVLPAGLFGKNVKEKV
jgi:hydrophobic amino acid uptake (HAAT) family ABC transporter permease livH